MITVERYTAEYCGPCKMLAPMMDDIKKSYTTNPNVVFTTIDIDGEPQKTQTANVRGVPTVIVYRNGIETARFVGVQSRPTYVGAINEELKWVE